jgi:hypothetical protein
MTIGIFDFDQISNYLFWVQKESSIELPAAISPKSAMEATQLPGNMAYNSLRIAVGLQQHFHQPYFLKHLR